MSEESPSPAQVAEHDQVAAHADNRIESLVRLAKLAERFATRTHIEMMVLKQLHQDYGHGEEFVLLARAIMRLSEGEVAA